jgi:hypothetical protein
VTTASDMANEIKAVLNDDRDWLNADLLYQFNGNKTYDIKDTSTQNSLEEFI